MNGDNDKPKKEEAQPEAPKEMQLTITRHLDTGQLDVEGPGNGDCYNKALCINLMDDALDFIKAHNARVNMSRIQKPSTFNRIKGAFGGKG